MPGGAPTVVRSTSLRFAWTSAMSSSAAREFHAVDVCEDGQPDRANSVAD